MSKFTSERKRVLGLIDAAFSTVQPPKGWEKYSQAEDFGRGLGDDFIPEYWRFIYEMDECDTKYVLPFVMKYFVRSKNRSVDDAVNLDLLLMNLNPAVQHEIGFGDFYEQMYSEYSSEQRGAVCEWLNFLKEYANEPVISGLDGVISYWCNNGN